MNKTAPNFGEVEKIEYKTYFTIIEKPEDSGISSSTIKKIPSILSIIPNKVYGI